MNLKIKKFIILVIYGIFCCLFLSSVARASASLEISPLRLLLPAANPEGAMTLKNQGDRSALIELEADAWRQDKNDSHDDYTKTHDLLAVPLVFTLPAHSAQIIRIGLRQPEAASQELSYRVYIQEVPVKRSGHRNALQTVLRIGIPVFIVPAVVHEKLSWQIKKTSPYSIQVQLLNEGNVHAKITQLDLVPSDQRRPFLVKHLFNYVLPGSQKIWKFKLNTPLNESSVNLVAVNNNVSTASINVPVR